jgi:hypothetical protein
MARHGDGHKISMRRLPARDDPNDRSRPGASAVDVPKQRAQHQRKAEAEHEYCSSRDSSDEVHSQNPLDAI